MKNIENIHILIMTLPSMFFKAWYALGMLDAMQFPIHRCHTVRGKFWQDYENLDAMVDAAIADGFHWFEKQRMKTESNPENPWSAEKIQRAFRANLWSVCRCLRYIAAQPYPHLIIEDDKKILIEWDKLLTRLKGLPATAEIAVLAQNMSQCAVAYNDNWVHGSYMNGSGATANVYTPKGARIALEIASFGCSNTHENMAPYYPEDVTFCAAQPIYTNRAALRRLTTLDVSDTGVKYHNKFFKGYGHHEIYDRWVDGLDIDGFLNAKVE